MSEAAILLQLLRLPGIGPAKLRLLLARLLQMGVSSQAIFKLTDERLLGDIKLTSEQVAALRRCDQDAAEDLRLCTEMGIHAFLPGHPNYPHRLTHILGRSAPVLLFAKGNFELLQYPALGISGSRRAGEANRRATFELSRTVAQRGWVVVSGGARGIDEAAHLGCMPLGPGTIVVMPTGLLKPNLRKNLHRHFEDGKTLLLSEFPPEYGWTVGCAMQRNRLLSGLSRAVVLVEPGLRGGTTGTGKIALRLGKPVFVLQSDGPTGPGAADLIDAGAQWLTPEGLSGDNLISLLNAAAQANEIASSTPRTQKLFPT